MVRAVIDTNVLINYLLSPDRASSAAAKMFQAALRGNFVLLLLEGVVAELERKLRENARLASRVPRQDSLALITQLHEAAEIIPSFPEPYPVVGRDRDDDFVIAHSVLARADYLVTWDKDLLDLIEIDGIHIVTPPAFLAALRAAGLL